MNVQIINNDNTHFISQISCNDNLLSWFTNVDETYFLIVRSEYGKTFDPEGYLSEYLRNASNLPVGEVVDILDNLSVFLFRKQMLLGYRCRFKPARYTVFVCEYSGDNLVIYTSESKVQHYDISDEVKLSMETIKPVSKGLFKKLLSGNQQERKCVRISLAGDMPVGYTDGALFYTYVDCKYEYPITKEMLRNGFYVPLFNDTNPVIKSCFMGFEGKLV